MDGYLDRPEATARALDAEGWLDTGDLGFLQTAYYRGPHRTFSVLGGPESKGSTDVVGVLADQPDTHDPVWQVFLVGVNRDRVLRNLRAVAVRIEDGELTWRVGEPSTNAAAAWLEHPEATGDLKDRPAYTEFPRLTDDIEATASADRITVIERRSGGSLSVSTATPETDGD